MKYIYSFSYAWSSSPPIVWVRTVPVNWRKQQTGLKREGFQGNCRILERRWSLGRIGFASVTQDGVVLGTSRRVFINRISIGIYTYMYQWHVFDGDTGTGSWVQTWLCIIKPRSSVQEWIRCVKRVYMAIVINQTSPLWSERLQKQLCSCHWIVLASKGIGLSSTHEIRPTCVRANTWTFRDSS